MLLEFIKAIKSLDVNQWINVLHASSGSYVERLEPEYYPAVQELMNMGYTIESVEGYGGEDMGSDYWGILKVTKDDNTMFLKFQGFYQSYSGVEFYHPYDLWKVTKKPVTRMEWVNE